MGADYHIYLHGVEGGQSLGDKTKPFSASQTSGAKSGSAFQTGVNYVQKGINVAQNPGSTGVAALAKVAPWVAAVIAIAKITDKVLTTGFAHQEEYTGHYKNNVMYNNFKTTVNYFFHPVNTFLQISHQQAQYNKQNKEIAQQNRLIGDSILKDFNVGV